MLVHGSVPTGAPVETGAPVLLLKTESRNFFATILLLRVVAPDQISLHKANRLQNISLLACGSGEYGFSITRKRDN